ncbi:hypothetical protein [Pedobacter agri]|uniref:hypothetical protein n=1 Tax=Pedobacter agri TaxID=454586 RepID=UPI00277D2B6F|nr:hypothetical protein [Pedobacter agri]MDQ1140109.1 hypothetical protein [Pedobacter agri]
MKHADIYDKALTDAYIIIENSIEEFSDLVIKLSMSGEYAQISNLFEVGESVVLSVGDFLSSNDENVQSIIKILNCLRDFQDLSTRR